MTNVYTYDDAFNASLEYFGGDELAASVFVSKYALKDLEGNIYERTPSDMHRRLAREFARIEKKYPDPMSESEIYELFSSWDVVPQGSPMSAIGNPYQFQSLSNCFVIESPYDSYGGIMKTDQEQAQIMKRRGGVGFDISTIRPKGIKTANAARTTDGIGVFMERFSNTCREVAQGGRRGALMLTCSVHYPEIKTFINIKRDLKKVTGANVSLRLTDEFMRAVKNGEKYQLRFPVDVSKKHSVSEFVDAREVWNDIVQSAHASAEPGLLFWDTVLHRGPHNAYKQFGFESTSCNPCSEIDIPPWDSCRLMLINLLRFVVNPFTVDARFDYGRFETVVKKAQRLMDDLVDLEIEAIEKILAKIDVDPEPDEVKKIEIDLWNRVIKMAKDGRRTGLGVTALGDTLAHLGIVYGSDASVDATGDIYRALCVNAYRSSVEMARSRGAFPVFSHDVEAYHPFITQIMNEDSALRVDYERYGRRNIALLTTAPAGSVSILTQTTSGCEPVFKTSYKRRKKINPDDKVSRVDYVDQLGDKWQEYVVYHHGLLKWMSVTGESDVSKSPYAGATANEIDWRKKIDLQAAAQKWICHSISNTLNLPNDVSVDVVNDVYMRAWELGCKGVTIYRDGSRSGVLVENDVDQQKKKEEPRKTEIVATNAPKRPKELQCDVHKVTVKGESYLVLVGLLNGAPYEIFAGLSEHVEVPKKVKSGVLIKNGKKDGVATYNLRIPIDEDDCLLFKDVVELFKNPVYGAFTRTLSLALRHGVPVQYLAEQLRKDKHSDITSFSSVIARVLSKNYIPESSQLTPGKKCPECSGTNLAHVDGCVTCMDCGNSKC